jgi:H+-transporting ATPase
MPHPRRGPVDPGSAWEFLGILPLSDPPREDSAATIAEARKHGIAIKMVTGDDVAIAREIARKLDLGQDIQPAAEIFPKEAPGRGPPTWWRRWRSGRG